MGCLGLMVLAKSQHKGDGFTPSTNVNLPSLSHSHYLNGNWSGKRESWWGKTCLNTETKFAFVFLSPRLFSAFNRIHDSTVTVWKYRFPFLLFSPSLLHQGSETHWFVVISPFSDFVATFCPRPLFSLIVLDCWGPSGSRAERHMGKKSLDDFPFLAHPAANLLHTP